MITHEAGKGKRGAGYGEKRQVFIRVLAKLQFCKNYRISLGNQRRETYTSDMTIRERLRIQYYLRSFLTNMEFQNKTPSFNEIVFAIPPLLKNGVTPEQQTILGVLEDIAEKTGADSWRLKKKDLTLFD